MGNAGKRKEMVKDWRVQQGTRVWVSCVWGSCVVISCVWGVCVCVWTMSNKRCSGTGKEGKTKEVVKDREVKRVAWDKVVCERPCVTKKDGVWKDSMYACMSVCNVLHYATANFANSFCMPCGWSSSLPGRKERQRRWMSPSATPATQSQDGHACHAKCQKCHACHAKWKSMLPSATPATQSDARCRQVPRLPRKQRRRPRRQLGTKRPTRAHACHAKWRSPCRQVPRRPRKVTVVKLCVDKLCWSKLSVEKWCVWANRACTSCVCEQVVCGQVVCTSSCVTTCVLTRCVWTSWSCV